ncbi:MAG TPA: hypothetical protein DCP03_19815 [Polaromonas sp.]|nr:hypothetical protein [Polaromonas sp.]
MVPGQSIICTSVKSALAPTVVSVLKLDNDQLNYMAASPAQGGDQAVLCARVTTRAKQAIAAPQRKQLVASGVLAADGGGNVLGTTNGWVGFYLDFLLRFFVSCR